jgi:hypothetical protein
MTHYRNDAVRALIRKSLNAAGLKTIGEIRSMSDDELRIMRGVGTGSFAYLRRTIGTGLKAKGNRTASLLRPATTGPQAH